MSSSDINNIRFLPISNYFHQDIFVIITRINLEKRSKYNEMFRQNFGAVLSKIKPLDNDSRRHQYTMRSIPLQKSYHTIDHEQYNFEKELGRGGYGVVYAARRLTDGKSFAVKVTSLVKLNRSDARIYGDAMLKELRMIKRLQSKSSHIIHMYTFDFNAKLGLGYIVMERGMHNLEKQLYFRPVQSIQMKFFWKQLADMAITLYNNGIVHLDIKPSNIVVFPHHQLKLIDLGIAKKKNSLITGPYGTFGYTAPEIYNNPSSRTLHATSVADVWSWGAILYRMVYHQPPDHRRVPYYLPPYGNLHTQDPLVGDILRHTLVPLQQRANPTWLVTHKYTTSR